MYVNSSVPGAIVAVLSITAVTHVTASYNGCAGVRGTERVTEETSG